MAVSVPLIGSVNLLLMAAMLVATGAVFIAAGFRRGKKVGD